MKLFDYIDYQVERLIRNWRQKQCFDWAVACGFVMDKRERALRFLEEALELAQACDITLEEADRLTGYVYKRPVGEIGQEIGGVMMTLNSLAMTVNLSVCTEERREFHRCMQLDRDVIRAKHAAKIAAGISRAA